MVTNLTKLWTLIRTEFLLANIYEENSSVLTNQKHSLFTKNMTTHKWSPTTKGSGSTVSAGTNVKRNIYTYRIQNVLGWHKCTLSEQIMKQNTKKKVWKVTYEELPSDQVHHLHRIFLHTIIIQQILLFPFLTFITQGIFKYPSLIHYTSIHNATYYYYDHHQVSLR